MFNFQIDYYVSLAKQYPRLRYIEDPIRSTSLKGWFMLKKAMVDENIDMKFGSRHLYSSPEEVEKVPLILPK